MSNNKVIEIFTDGACRGNPGPGGWGTLLRYADKERELSGYKPDTTNNQMELMAAIQGLEALTRPCQVVLTTDSQYVRQGITEWLAGWKRKGWKTAAGKPVKNLELWQRLDAATPTAPDRLALGQRSQWTHGERTCRPTCQQSDRRETNMSRQIILDTETTGLDPKDGHRIIEIGCVEMLNRRLTGNNFHHYLQPDREIDAEARSEVHGITNEFLADKPRFEEMMDDLLAYLRGAELIIHNAPFDIGFLNHELRLVDPAHPPLTDYCTVTDTLVMARQLFPGQRASLDALCKRYEINNAHRTLHGALLDAEILADVYLAMTGGQVSLLLGADDDGKGGHAGGASIRRVVADVSRLRVIQASEEELASHAERLAAITKAAGGKCLFAPPNLENA